jgi:DNA-binding MarR family transcriptional regulator
MPMQFMFDNQQLKTWLLLHQTYNNISKCEDIIFARAGLTTQQHTILMAIKFMDGTATPSRISQWTDINIISVTMITNRMEKEGLVERVRR